MCIYVIIYIYMYSNLIVRPQYMLLEVSLLQDYYLELM